MHTLWKSEFSPIHINLRKKVEKRFRNTVAVVEKNALSPLQHIKIYQHRKLNNDRQQCYLGCHNLVT